MVEVLSIPYEYGTLNSVKVIFKKESRAWGYTQKTVTQVTPEAPAHPCLLQRYKHCV
jgi:hypothetical protein